MSCTITASPSSGGGSAGTTSFDDTNFGFVATTVQEAFRQVWFTNNTIIKNMLIPANYTHMQRNFIVGINAGVTIQAGGELFIL